MIWVHLRTQFIKMPFCSNCGTKLDDGAKFCANCGTKVAAPQGQPQPVECKVVEQHEVKESVAAKPEEQKIESVTIKVCHGCGKPFELDTAKEAFGHVYHNECFKCHLCGMRLFSFGKFYNDDGELMCHQCMLKSVPKCAKCNKPLIGDFIQCGGRNWHKQCVPDDL